MSLLWIPQIVSLLLGVLPAYLTWRSQQEEYTVELRECDKAFARWKVRRSMNRLSTNIGDAMAGAFRSLVKGVRSAARVATRLNSAEGDQ